jgi:UDPglucose 6-dehydrogenase
VKALVKTAEELGHDFEILKAVESANDKQKKRLLAKIITHYGGEISGKTFCVWGLSFKPRTDDIREAPSIDLISGLLARGANVQASDPAGIVPMKNVFAESDSMKYFRKNTDALDGANALVIVTEWNEFRNPNFEMISTKIADKVIFDGRNIYDPERMREYGFTYYGIGRR